MNLQLLLKLLGSSLADRPRARAHCACSWMRLQERNQLAELTANDGVWDFDVDGHEVYFSPRWRAMLGYDDADLNGNFDWRSLVHPDDMARVQARIRDHVAGKTPMFESVHRMRHRSGEWRWVSSRAKALLDEHGRLRRLVGVELDITEQQALRGGAVPREGERPDHAAVDRRRRGHHRRRLGDRLHQPGGRGAHRLAAGGCDGQPVDEVFRGFHEETCEPLENPLSRGDPAHPRRSSRCGRRC